MIRPIPAEGYRLITGKRNPPAAAKGYWVQLATEQAGQGWCDLHGPWPTVGPVWKWRGDNPQPWEVVAVKEAA